jgi:hypothetical protein
MKPWKKAPSVPNSTGVPPKKKNPTNRIKKYLNLYVFIEEPADAWTNTW